MKTFNNVMKVVSSVCFMFLHILLAVWAIRSIMQLSRQIRHELSEDIVVGRIVRDNKFN